MNNYAAKLCLIIIIFLTIFAAPSLESVGSRNIRHQSAEPKVSLNENSQARPVPVNKSLNGTVFGYLPSWKYSDSRSSIRYELLSHLAVFDFPADPSGNITYPDMWPWTDVIDSAHAKGVKVIMTVTNTDSTQIHQILTNNDVKKKTFLHIKNIITTFNLDGVNIDFESLKRSDRNSAVNNYMRELTALLHRELPGSEVSFAGPPVNWGGWNFKGLADACDYIFVMGYDYFDAKSRVSGPSASLNGSYYSVESTLLSTVFGYGEVTASNPRKLILGVPYYGYHWITETGEPQAFNLQFVESTTYSTVIQEAGRQKLKRFWDRINNVPWYRYQQDGQWHQVWYEDSKSIGMKYDYAISKNLRGVGIWALGFDGNRPELWREIEKRFHFGYLTTMAALPPDRIDRPFDVKTFVPKAIQPRSGKKGA